MQSTADSENHGAKQAVDNDESSYWQSDPGSAGAQELTIDLGGARKLSAVEIVRSGYRSAYAESMAGAASRLASSCASRWAVGRRKVDAKESRWMIGIRVAEKK